MVFFAGDFWSALLDFVVSLAARFAPALEGRAVETEDFFVALVLFVAALSVIDFVRGFVGGGVATGGAAGLATARFTLCFVDCFADGLLGDFVATFAAAADVFALLAAFFDAIFLSTDAAVFDVGEVALAIFLVFVTFAAFAAPAAFRVSLVLTAFVFTETEAETVFFFATNVVAAFTAGVFAFVRAADADALVAGFFAAGFVFFDEADGVLAADFSAGRLDFFVVVVVNL